MTRLMVVEDDVELLQTLHRALTTKGYQVVDAPNGVEAVRLFDEQTIDLVILDMIMPGMDGLETILELFKQAPGTKIIAISGGGRIGPINYLIAAKEAGAMFTLQKPFELEDLEIAIQQTLEAKPKIHVVNEQRKGKRYPSKLDAILESPVSLKPKVVSDISKDGVFINMSKLMEVGSEIHFRLVLQDSSGAKEIGVKGKVCFCLENDLPEQFEDNSGVGVQLLGFPCQSDEENFYHFIDVVEALGTTFPQLVHNQDADNQGEAK